uniref:EF-hand domain-containing protein n=1 Tax=Trichuris muris TaxID=70415 RepID=A0A5S6QAK0_TRIMR
MSLSVGANSYIPIGLKSVSDFVQQYCFETIPADRSYLREIFERYASADAFGLSFMQPEVFVQRYLGLCETCEADSTAVTVIARAADCDKDGRISFEDFVMRKDEVLSHASLSRVTLVPAKCCCPNVDIF